MIGGLQGEEWKFIQKYLAWSRRNRGKFAPRMGCANFESVVRISHNTRTTQGVVRKFRTSLEQLSSEGHIFLVSAPNRTRFKALDS